MRAASTCVGMSAALTTACFFAPTGLPTESAGGGTGTTTGTTGEPLSTTLEPPSPTATAEPDGTAATTAAESSTGVPPSPLTVDCGQPPKGAQAAMYTYTPEASGGIPAYVWKAGGLPPGLTIQPNTGTISGKPTDPGEYIIELTLTDEQGTEVMTTCPVLEIAERLRIDEGALLGDGPCITAGGKTILSYLVGGDGTLVKCSTPLGVGDGKLPSGLAVDPETCAITGALTETRYGGWAWIVAAEQSGVRVYAPYCATQPLQAPTAYKIIGNHSGELDNELDPLVVDLPAGEQLRFDGDGEPRFEITAGICGDSCFFGFVYRVTVSPFGSGPCESDKDGCFNLCPLVPDLNEPDGDKLIQCDLIPKVGTPKLGFSHEMWAKGDVAADEFADRPFIIQWSLDYCLSSVQADCQGKEKILANGDGTNLDFPVIFRWK